MSGNKDLDWKIYESITKYIYETLGRQSGVTIKGYGKNCVLVGKSGVSHQIDVLTSHSDGIHNFETAIECKFWKQKVDKDVVMKLAAIMEDADISKGIIVSRSGFTKDGQDYAKFKNIGIVILREWDEKDQDETPKEFEFGILQINMNILVTGPKILQIAIGNNRFLDVQDEFDLFNYYLEQKDKNRVAFYDYVTDFRLDIAKQNKMQVEITKTYKLSGSRLYRRGISESVELDEITITGKLTQRDESKKLEYSLVDKVWLIMKSIFDERTFTFSENGLLIENKNL
ncbi:restriction endonuclease [Flavobacterium sp.]|uniref:restriction endonuclease n=1 Tax=Flavobacterium sp. TaxID=239 RepID=UPI0026293C67|nr:restriction endonuclease [Flavobacterium sp.]